MLLAIGFEGHTFAQNKKRIQLEVKERKLKKKRGKAAPDFRRTGVFAFRVESKLIKKINQTTKYLMKTAKSLPKRSPQRLQILERVLNLYMENASYTRNSEERTYDKKWRAWDKRGRRGAEPRLKSAKSNRLWQKVIKQSTLLMQEYPKNRNADVVLYNKAIGLQYISREKDAARILSQLVEDFKGSNIVGEAYASLGDYYFDRNDFRNAQNSYQKAIRYKRSKRYLWSVFKLGWCAYNLGKYQAAMRNWKLLVSKAKHGNKKGKHLGEEALRDLVYVFAELRQVEAAIAYYKANGGRKFIGPFLTLLADTLSDQGAYSQAIKAYKRFQKVVPFDPEGPNIQKEIIGLYYVTGRIKNVWAELSKFNARYGTKSAWGRKNRSLAKETKELIKDQIMYYSTLTHQKAIKEGNRRLNIEARTGYLLYLQQFPASKEIAGVKFLIADIEYYLKRFRSAGQYYMDIGKMGKKKAVRYNPVTKKASSIHRVAAVEMVGAFVKDFKTEFDVIKKRTPNFKKPRPISKKAMNYIKACELYIKWYPKDSKRVKSCDTGIANIYYRNGHKKKSIQYLKVVAKKYPRQKEGPNAVKLMIVIAKDNKVELDGIIKDLAKIPSYKKGVIGKFLKDLKVGTEKELITKEKDTLKRAKLYESQARKYPKDPDVDKLWYNAAIDYMKAGAIDKSIKAHNVIVKRFPKTPQAKDSLLTIARLQEKRLEYSAAVASFQQYIRRYPKSKNISAVVSSTCSLQVAIDSPKAANTCISLASSYPDIARNSIETLIRGAARSKQYAKMNKLIQKFYLNRFRLEPNAQILAWKRIYDAQKGSKAATRAAGQMQRIYASSASQVDGEALRAIGKFKFDEVKRLLPRYSKMKLQGGTVDRLAASIQKKAASLLQLENAFQGVLQLKDAYSGIESYVQLGIANEDFADSLDNPPAIKGAKKQDVVKELSAQIKSRRESAKTWYKAAMDVASRFSVYNAAVVKAVDGLARVRGGDYRFYDFVPKADYLGNEVPSNWARKLKEGT